MAGSQAGKYASSYVKKRISDTDMIGLAACTSVAGPIMLIKMDIDYVGDSLYNNHR